MLHAVIMAGGRGTRFWPASRKAKPKPFLPVVGNQTLLQQTVARCQPLIPLARTWVIAARENVGLVREQLPALAEKNCVGEPVGRNTAPCLAVAAALVANEDPDAVLVALPADHLIKEEPAFRSLLEQAYRLAAAEPVLVTVGLRPRRPHTGYGYIRVGAVNDGDPSRPVYQVREFVEKPDLATAEGYLASGDYYWNGGIFVVGAQTYLDMTRRHLPAVAAALAEVGLADLGALYERLPSVSIDYGILEKEERLACIPADLTWSDVGNWRALYEALTERAGANIASGRLVTLDSAGNCFQVGEKTVAAVGINDLVVVDTGDVLLLCPQAQAERVRELVALLEQDRELAGLL